METRGRELEKGREDLTGMSNGEMAWRNLEGVASGPWAVGRGRGRGRGLSFPPARTPVSSLRVLGSAGQAGERCFAEAG